MCVYREVISKCSRVCKWGHFYWFSFCGKHFIDYSWGLWRVFWAVVESSKNQVSTKIIPLPCMCGTSSCIQIVNYREIKDRLGKDFWSDEQSMLLVKFLHKNRQTLFCCDGQRHKVPAESGTSFIRFCLTRAIPYFNVSSLWILAKPALNFAVLLLLYLMDFFCEMS